MDSFARQRPLFYGWWIVLAAFLNLFFSVGIVYYGFPVFYPSLIESLKFSRAQATEGFLIGFVIVAPLFGLVAGALIDRLGPRRVIRLGVGFVGTSLILMAWISRLWQYHLLCTTEVIGYVLTGPISNQVLVSNWFSAKRGRAMGYAYLGLGLGGATAPVILHVLISHFGWRSTFEFVGIAILVVLFPVAQWVTRSKPQEMGLLPDGPPSRAASPIQQLTVRPGPVRSGLGRAFHSLNFWLLVAGSTLTILAIGTVIQHLILFLKDQGYSTGAASRVLSGVLISSLAGRVIVGYFADRYSKKNVMALFYFVLALAIPLLLVVRRPAGVWGFAICFGFAMGADYMLIPLVTAECFGLAKLGKLLAFIIMADSIGQTLGPVLAGRIYDVYGNYHLAWILTAGAGVLGAVLIYFISPRRGRLAGVEAAVEA